MKQLIFLFLLSSLAFAGPIRAAGLYEVVPADTVTGHAHLVRRISQELCTKLTNDHTTNFASLTSTQAMQLTQQLFADAMQRDSVAVMALMEKGIQQNIQPQQVGQTLGKDVVILLGHECPASLPLITRLMQTEQGQQTLAAQQATVISAAEKKVLQPLAASLCTQLAANDAKGSFAKLTPSQREKTFMAALQKAFKQHTPALLKYYGAAQLDEKLRSGELDNKVGLLAPSEGSCAQYLLLIKADKPTK